MRDLFGAAWQGILSGTQARDRSGATPPQQFGFDSNIAQALYWAGFEVANVIVFGKRTT